MYSATEIDNKLSELYERLNMDMKSYIDNSIANMSKYVNDTISDHINIDKPKKVAKHKKPWSDETDLKSYFSNLRKGDFFKLDPDGPTYIKAFDCDSCRNIAITSYGSIVKVTNSKLVLRSNGDEFIIKKEFNTKE